MKSRITKNNTLTIGSLAKAAGVGLGTVRFYQRRGLLPQPSRPVDGYRSYAARDVERLLQIRRIKDLGFTLSEIQALFIWQDRQDCAAIKAAIDAKLQAVKARVRRLQSALKELGRLKDRCAGDCKGNCPLVDDLCRSKPR